MLLTRVHEYTHSIQRPVTLHSKNNNIEDVTALYSHSALESSSSCLESGEYSHRTSVHKTRPGRLYLRQPNSDK